MLDHRLAVVRPMVFLEWCLLRNWRKYCPEEHILLQLRGANHCKPVQGHAVRKQLSNLESLTWCKFLFLYTESPKSPEELCDTRRSSLGGSLLSANVSVPLPRAAFQVFLRFAAVEFIFLL